MGWYSLTKFGKTRAVFTQFLVVRKWLTGQKEGEKRGKWFPKWLTESRFWGCFGGSFRPSFPAFFWLWQFGIVWANLNNWIWIWCSTQIINAAYSYACFFDPQAPWFGPKNVPKGHFCIQKAPDYVSNQGLKVFYRTTSTVRSFHCLGQRTQPRKLW